MKRNQAAASPVEPGTVEPADRARLPPGQTLVTDWPVLHTGGVPSIDLRTWRLDLGGLLEAERSFTWEQFMALPQTTITSDIHCVTSWSKFDNEWRGVSMVELMRHVRPRPAARHVIVQAHGGYTTNLPLAELVSEGALLAHSHGGAPLLAQHGWPLRLVVPHLYFWKSAKWVRGLIFMDEERLGFWERLGYHNHGDPWNEERYA